MGIFDDLKSTLTETSQELTQKAKETSEIYHLNNGIKAKEKEIEKLMTQIGMAFYSTYKEECENLFPELANQVSTLQKEIAENKEAIEKLSAEEICPKCGKKLNPGSKFCIYCGASIDAVEVKMEETEELAGPRCENCGELLEDDAMFCTNCGTPVNR